MTYAFVSTLFIAFLTLSSFTKKDKIEKLDELTAKKITIIGEDGSPRMVLSNETRQTSGRMDGKPAPERKRPAGIIFFNNEGDECGGIIFQAKKKNGKLISGMSFTMDQYKDDQVVQILNSEQYADGKSNIQRGLIINQYPSGTSMVERNKKIEEIQKIKDKKERTEKLREVWQKEGAKGRLFLGKTDANSSGLFLRDPEGKPKLRIYVDENGDPKIETIDDKGMVKDFLKKED